MDKGIREMQASIHLITLGRTFNSLTIGDSYNKRVKSLHDVQFSHKSIVYNLMTNFKSKSQIISDVTPIDESKLIIMSNIRKHHFNSISNDFVNDFI